MLLDTDLLDELIFELDDLTLVEELTDCTTDFWTLSETFDDDVSETLLWTLSWALFSAFWTKLDWTFPSTFFSTLSATLFCDLLALSMIPVAVFSTLDYDEIKKKKQEKIENFRCYWKASSPVRRRRWWYRTYLSRTFRWSCRTSRDTALIHFNKIHFCILWIFISSSFALLWNCWKINEIKILTTAGSEHDGKKNGWNNFSSLHFDIFRQFFFLYFPPHSRIPGVECVCVYFLHFSQVFKSCHKNRHFTCFCLNFFSPLLPACHDVVKVFCERNFVQATIIRIFFPRSYLFCWH